MQKQVAEVAKALYQRPDELAVVPARTINRRASSLPLMLAAGAEALPQIACTLSSIDIPLRCGRMPTMKCTAEAVQQTVDRTTPCGLLLADLMSVASGS